jgi:hypothetical protein
LFFIKLLQTKRLYNSKGIRWNGAKSEAKISWDGLKASVSKCDWFPTLFYSTDWQYVFANKGFVVSEAYSGKDNFPGTIVYYFEVTHMATITSTIKFISKSNKKKVKFKTFSKFQAIYRWPFKWHYSCCSHMVH